MSILITASTPAEVKAINETSSVKEEPVNPVSGTSLGAPIAALSTPAVIQSESTIGGFKNAFMDYLPLIAVVLVGFYTLSDHGKKK